MIDYKSNRFINLRKCISQFKSSYRTVLSVQNSHAKTLKMLTFLIVFGVKLILNAEYFWSFCGHKLSFIFVCSLFRLSAVNTQFRLQNQRFKQCRPWAITKEIFWFAVLDTEWRYQIPTYSNLITSRESGRDSGLRTDEIISTVVEIWSEKIMDKYILSITQTSKYQCGPCMLVFSRTRMCTMLYRNYNNIKHRNCQNSNRSIHISTRTWYTLYTCNEILTLSTMTQFWGRNGRQQSRLLTPSLRLTSSFYYQNYSMFCWRKNCSCIWRCYSQLSREASIKVQRTSLPWWRSRGHCTE